MRFHVGFTFRPKNIIKFLIPILIGIGAYFGFPSIFGFIKVNALVNLNTKFDFTIDEDLTSSVIANYQNIMSDLGDSTYYDYVITYKGNQSFLVFLTKASFHSVYVYKEYSYTNFHLDDDNYIYIAFDTTTDLTNSSVYSLIKSCYVGGFDNDSNCWSIDDGNGVYVGSGSNNPGIVSIGLGNDDDLTATLTQYYYYSSVPLYNYIDSNNENSNDVFYKSLYINDTLIEEGDNFPTYYSLYIGEPEPEPPIPSQDTIVNNIYWFTDNITEYDVLVNIYVLLFLYCFSMIILKLLIIVKGVKW